jgi:uncharacterized protein (TIGR02217 family)
MTIHAVQLPENIERGAEGGPEFLTDIITVGGGAESRNAKWAFPRIGFDIGYGLRSMNDIHTVRDFFWARRGRLFGFLFKDWGDYEVTTATTFGTGDAVETAFQLIKTYNDGFTTFNRPISRPLTYNIYVDTILQTEGGGADYTIDTTTGIVTFNAAPAASADITWDGTFLVPVRFDDDRLDINIEVWQAGRIQSIPIVELREEI